MTITTVPPWPLRSENLTQTVFSARAEASLQAISPAIDDINALTSAYSNGTNATSSTSNSIGTGAKTFTVPAGLGYQIGMTLRIANSATAYMTGDVSSYDSSTGSLVMNITSVNGSGTYASWTFSLAATGAVPNKASQATAEAGTNDNDYMTALKTSQAIAAKVVAATDTTAGVVELATNAEAIAGTDTARAVTPSGLAAARSRYVGSTTKNMADASTTQVITGVGFRPTRVRFYMGEASGAASAFSIGEDNGTSAFCIYDRNAASAGTNGIDTTSSIHAQGSAGNQVGKISAFGSDGFTITWTRTSTGPAFTATINYIAEA